MPTTAVRSVERETECAEEGSFEVPILSERENWPLPSPTTKPCETEPFRRAFFLKSGGI
jgi:hypothetical protein